MKKTMLLLTCNEWLGAGRRMELEQKLKTVATNEKIAFCTCLPLNAALNTLRKYQELYNGHYLLAVNFSLLSVAEIELITEDNRDFFNVRKIEELPKTINDFEK